MARQIKGLKWARLGPNPWPKTKLNGTKAAGIRFERLVARKTGGQRDIWYEFEDENGRGWCSPDVFLIFGGQLTILECKLTDCQEAKGQLLGLYLPVVGAVHGYTPRGVVVAKNLKPFSRNIVTSLTEALAHPADCPVLHWLGRGNFPL